MPDAHQHRVFLIDYNESRRGVRSRTLRQAGYRTVESTDRQRVLEALRKDMPALVVLAVDSADSEDLELCRQMKADPTLAQIMMLQLWSSRLRGAVPMAQVESGADAYMIEPCEAQEFLATAKLLLRLYDREAETCGLRAELRANHDEFHAWFENTSIGICQSDPFTGEFLRVNRRFCDLLGYDQADLVGRPFFEFIHPEDRDEDFLAFMRLGREQTNEYQAIKRQNKKDGSSVWTDITVRLLRDSVGKPLFTVAMVQDISARKRHEAGRALLLDVTRGIVEDEGDAAALAAAIFEQIRDYLGIDICFNYQLDRDQRMLRLVNRSGVPPQWVEACLELEVGQAICGWVASRMTPVIADHRRIATDDRAGLLRAMGVRAFACHPLTARDGAVLGTLSFGSTQRDRFDADEVAFMAEISHVLALTWERKRAEEALQRERESLSLALFAGHMGVYDYDMAHNRLWWSPEIYSVFGVPAEHFTPSVEAFTDLIHPDDRATFWELFNHSVVHHLPFNCEFRIRGVDGELRWIANRGQTEYDANGRAARHLGIAIDITEHKRTEETARRWQRLFEQSHFGLAHEDARSDSFVAVNRAFAEHRGYTVEELIGQSGFMIFPAELRESVRQTINDADEKGHALFETLHQCKDGRTFPVLLEVTTIKDAAGAPQSRMVYALDISRLKSAEAALRESEEQFRGFFESAAVGTALCDPETRHFRKVNQTFCRMVGYSADELAALTPYDLTYPADRAYHLEIAGRWHRGESESFQIEKRFGRKDGSPLWVRVNANMVRDGAGRPVMGVGIVSDISERKRIQFNAEFMLKLGRELGRLTEADEIGNTAVRAIAQYLGAPACGLLSIDLTRGSAELNYQWCSDERSFAPTYRIGDFAGEELLDEWRRGEAVAINDVDVDARTQFCRANFAAQNSRSFAAAPLLSEGVLEAVLAVSAPAPRNWMSDEVRCLQNVIARVWPAIKRARAIAALRAGEASLRSSNHELARFNRAAVGRELRMIELKREINAMCGQLGQPPRYPLEFDHQP